MGPCNLSFVDSHHSQCSTYFHLYAFFHKISSNMLFKSWESYFPQSRDCILDKKCFKEGFLLDNRWRCSLSWWPELELLVTVSTKQNREECQCSASTLLLEHRAPAHECFTPVCERSSSSVNFLETILRLT